MSYLKIFNFVTSAKALFPNEFTFTGSRDLGVDIFFEGATIELIVDLCHLSVLVFALSVYLAFIGTV